MNLRYFISLHLLLNLEHDAIFILQVLYKRSLFWLDLRSTLSKIRLILVSKLVGVVVSQWNLYLFSARELDF